MKSEGAGLLFKLRGDRTPEEVRDIHAEAARAAGALVLQSPYFRAAETLGALAFDLSHIRAQAVGAMGDSLSLARGALAHSLGTFTIAAETVRARGEEMRAAIEAAGRLGSAGALADGHGFAAARAVAATAFASSARPLHFKRSCEDDAAPQTVDEPEGVM